MHGAHLGKQQQQPGLSPQGQSLHLQIVDSCRSMLVLLVERRRLLHIAGNILVLTFGLSTAIARLSVDWPL